jgi:hypothetical protein
LTRLDEGGRVKLADELPQTLLRFDPATHAARAIEEPLDERPPLRTILESP